MLIFQFARSSNAACVRVLGDDLTLELAESELKVAIIDAVRIAVPTAKDAKVSDFYGSYDSLGFSVSKEEKWSRGGHFQGQVVGYDWNVFFKNHNQETDTLEGDKRGEFIKRFLELVESLLTWQDRNNVIYWPKAS